MSRFGAFPRHYPPAGGWLGRQLFGGRKESFPQLRLGSCFASLRIPQSGTGLTQPARTTPFLVFISAVCSVAFASDFCIARLRRRSSFSHGRPSGNVRGSNANALDPPSRSRASPLAEGERGASGSSLRYCFVCLKRKKLRQSK